MATGSGERSRGGGEHPHGERRDERDQRGRPGRTEAQPGIAHDRKERERHRHVVTGEEGPEPEEQLEQQEDANHQRHRFRDARAGPLNRARPRPRQRERDDEEGAEPVAHPPDEKPLPGHVDGIEHQAHESEHRRRGGPGERDRREHERIAHPFEALVEVETLQQPRVHHHLKDHADGDGQRRRERYVDGGGDEGAECHSWQHARTTQKHRGQRDASRRPHRRDAAFRRRREERDFCGEPIEQRHPDVQGQVTSAYGSPPGFSAPHAGRSARAQSKL